MVRVPGTPVIRKVMTVAIGLLAAEVLLLVGTAGTAAASSNAPCAAAARACVDLPTQRAWLLRNGMASYGPVPVATGKAGAPTTPGIFRVSWKDLHHRSSIFDNAPMPYSVFFNGGEAFHEGSVSVRSHGCIHLARDAAQAFYSTLRIGDVVQVVS